ncbi:MAG: T9SS type A sorting domain-containing protein [Candidatus Delongbacteria bacterium]|nr:T9SS type A sorting domain-containing protein [Candidatus Delongbacteria bacterium]
MAGLKPINSDYDNGLHGLTQPQAVSNLQALGGADCSNGLSEGQIRLSWIAGRKWEDGGTYQNKSYFYIIKYDTSPIWTETAWNNASEIPQSMVPQDSGQQEILFLPTNGLGLALGQSYYFAIRSVVIDSVIRYHDPLPPPGGITWALISDTSSLLPGSYTTIPCSPQRDCFPPDIVSWLDSVSYQPDLGKICLYWRGVGDDYLTGKPDLYTIVWDTLPITDTIRFEALAGGSGKLQIREPIYSPGVIHTVCLDSISNGLVPGRRYYFAIRAYDNRNNGSQVESCLGPVSYYCSHPHCYPPDPIRDLKVHGRGEDFVPESSLVLTWTAPRDANGLLYYDIRMARDTIRTVSQFNAAVRIAFPYRPKAADQPESLRISSLMPDSLYFFSIRSVDSLLNISLLSNITCSWGRAQRDNVPPGPVNDLRAFVTPATPEGGIEVEWTYPGDNLGAGTIDSMVLAYSTAPFDTLCTVDNVPACFDSVEFHYYYPKRYYQMGGQKDTITVPGLIPGKIYHFRAQFWDEVKHHVFSNLSSDTSQIDLAPPAAVTDLEIRLHPTIPNQAVLSFTATGDDGYLGRASAYEIKYDTGRITPTLYNSSPTIKRYAYGKIPVPSGQRDTIIIQDSLVGGRIYYFALKMLDDRENKSPLSNVDTVAMPVVNDLWPPTTINDLRAETGTLAGTITLTWSAPLEQGSTQPVKSYSLAYSYSPILTQSDYLNAVFYPQSWVPRPSGSLEQKTIYGLVPGVKYYFAIKSSDYNYNLSGLSNSASASAYASLGTPTFTCRSSDTLVSIFDTIAVDIYYHPYNQATTGLSFYATLDPAYLLPVDMDPWQSGIQPFVSADYYSPYGVVLENDTHYDQISGTENGIAGYQVDFTEVVDTLIRNFSRSSEGKIATLYLRGVAATPVNTVVTIDVDSLTGRQSMGIDIMGKKVFSLGINHWLRVQNYLVMVQASLQGRSRYEGYYRFRVLDMGRSPLGIAYSPLNVPLDRVIGRDGLGKIPAVPIGNYIVLVKEARYLCGEAAVTVTGLQNGLQPFPVWTTLGDGLKVKDLRGGDANDDNTVNLADFGQMALYYDTPVPAGAGLGEARWQVDFNADGQINLADFSILVSNFGEHGSLMKGRNPLCRSADWPDEQFQIRIIQNDSLSMIQALDFPPVLGYSLVFISPEINLQPGDFVGLHEVMKFGKMRQDTFYYNVVLKTETPVSGHGCLAYAQRMDLNGLKWVEILDTNRIVRRMMVKPVGVDDDHSSPVSGDLCHRVYPNPFNSQTVFSLSNLGPDPVELTVYDVTGQRVQSVIWQSGHPSIIRYVWNAQFRNRILPSGLYFYSVINGQTRVSGKIVLMK